MGAKNIEENTSTTSNVLPFPTKTKDAETQSTTSANRLPAILGGDIRFSSLISSAFNEVLYDTLLKQHNETMHNINSKDSLNTKPQRYEISCEDTKESDTIGLNNESKGELSMQKEYVTKSDLDANNQMIDLKLDNIKNETFSKIDNLTTVFQSEVKILNNNINNVNSNIQRINDTIKDTINETVRLSSLEKAEEQRKEAEEQRKEAIDTRRYIIGTIVFGIISIVLTLFSLFK